MRTPKLPTDCATVAQVIVVDERTVELVHVVPPIVTVAPVRFAAQLVPVIV